MQWHRLLRRQLKKNRLSEEVLDQIQPLLRTVHSAYLSNDQDIAHLENVLELSSQELFRANQLLKQDIANKNMALQRANERYQLIAANINEVLFQLDTEGIIQYVNDAWEELTGVKVELSVGKNINVVKQFLNDDDQAVVDNILNPQIVAVNKVLEWKGNNNEIKWIELHATNFKNASGKHSGSVGTIVDITNLKMSQIALIKAKDAAEKASQAKNEFLSTISHEIRTPLNAIIGISNLLLMNEFLPTQLDNLESLKFSSEHLLSLINDILDFSKIESGVIELEHAEFSLRDLLLRLNKNFSYAAKEKGIEMKIKKDTELPEVLIGDVTRLSQILTNLLNNAIKFTKKGRVVLDVDLIDSSQGIVKIKFAVTDTGIGIKKEILPKIFEKFSQASASTTREYGGTGLGLPICKKLLELHNSDLFVESKVGKGSTFWFILEFRMSDRFNLPSPRHLDLQSSFGEIKGMNVLVAEDNNLNIQVVKQFLKKWQVNFDIVENGFEAVEMAQRKDYDVILMDLQMPVLDGYEATKVLRKMGGKFKNLPIVALTASTTLSVKREVKEIGMNGYVMKPFKPKELYSELRLHFEKYRLNS